MKVFLSWSGERSRYIAEALRNWLPKVLQAAKPWMSEQDISAGTRWFSEIGLELEHTKVGIVCITPENQHNPWIMFEAGALSKTLTEAFVCPYLYDLQPSQLTGPMTQFQATCSDKDGTYKVVQMLNKSLVERQLPAVQLEEIYDVWWPKLEDKFKNTPALAETIQKRSTEEIIGEILSNTREQLRRENIRLQSLQQKEEKLDYMLSAYASFAKHYELMQDQINKVVEGDDNLKLNKDAMSGIKLSNPFKTIDISGIVQNIKELSEQNKNITIDLLKNQEPVAE